MLQSKKCPKCGSRKIAGPHRIIEGLVIDLPGLFTSTLETFTCAKCGYTEFYSDKMGLKNVRSDGRFVLNPPVRRYVKCPSCGTTTKKGHVKCHECGANVTVQK